MEAPGSGYIRFDDNTTFSGITQIAMSELDVSGHNMRNWLETFDDNMGVLHISDRSMAVDFASFKVTAVTHQSPG